MKDAIWGGGGTFINQNLKLGDTIFHRNKIGGCAMRVTKFQVNISPYVLYVTVTSQKVRWSGGTASKFDERSVVSFTPRPFYT